MRRPVGVPGAQVRQTPVSLNDADFDWYIYNGPNRNQQPLHGSHGFEQRLGDLHMVRWVRDNKWHIHYGMRQQGDRFLVHREDAALAPHLFRRVMERRPEEERPAPPAPAPIAHDFEGPEVAIDLGDNGDDLTAHILGAKATPATLPTLAETATIRQRKGNGPLDLQSLPGVTPQIAQQLQADGIQTAGEFIALGVDGLQDYKGVGPVKAQRMMKAMETWAASHS